MHRPTLLKVSGAQLREGPEFEELSDVLARMACEGQLILVHGGGPEIAELQERLGLKPRYLDGLRITDEESLRIAEMVLSGSVNKRLTARLVIRGVKAIGRVRSPPWMQIFSQGYWRMALRRSSHPFRWERMGARST